MDIQILLFLQEVRNGAGAFLADFMAKMTFLGEINSAIVIMAIVYWCFSKETGAYLLMGWAGNRLLNGVLKVTACVYRPWIRDARIVPYGDAITTATGYSFPSGHTMNAATIFGGTALKKDLPKSMRIVLFALLFFVAFSRNFLGVHTPQDVLVGAIGGTLMMFLVMKVLEWVDKNPKMDIAVVVIGFLLAVGVAVYAGVKPYPEDYDEAGKLIVDGAKMAKDTFKGVGFCTGILTGWILERRFIKFSTTDIPMKIRAARLVFGLLIYYAVSLILSPAIKNWISGPAGILISSYLQMFYVMFLYPCGIKLLERPKTGEKGSDCRMAYSPEH